MILDPNAHYHSIRTEQGLADFHRANDRIKSDKRSGSIEARLDGVVYSTVAGFDGVVRSCLLLRTVERWDYSRIAESLGISESQAIENVQGARQALRDESASLLQRREETQD